MPGKKLDRNGKLTFCYTEGYCRQHDINHTLTSGHISEKFIYNDYKIFQEITESLYKQKAELFYHMIDSEEAAALMHYSDAGFKPINKSLIGLVEPRKTLISLIDSSISKAPVEQKIVYRGIKRDIEKSVGETYTFKTFTSSSYNPQKAFEFTDAKQPILLIIETKLGAPISLIHREMEVLLPRNQEFLVTELEYSSLRLFYPETKEYSVSKKETKIYRLSEI